MTRLPTPQADSGTWGDILNAFLSVEHNSDGTLKSSGSLATKADDSSVVHNSGNESIAGVKTFTSQPVVPTPTSPTAVANKSYVDSVAGSGSTPDADAVTKGKLQLAGDLSGTAASPTVPGLASKVSTSRQVIAGTGLSGGGDLSADRTLAVSYGTTAGTAAQGDDSRIVNAVQHNELVFNVKDYGAIGDNSTDDRAAIQAAITAAGAVGGIVMLKGTHVINGTLNLVSGITIDGYLGSLRQTASLSMAFKIDGLNNITIRGVTVTGLGTDYVNNSGVYQASAVWMTNTCSDITIEKCTFINNAGGGVICLLPSSRIHVRNCKIIGPGAPPIVSVTDNYGAGVGFSDDVNDWDVTGCEISQYCQGIVTGRFSNVRIIGNYIHDIVGQHGIYLECVDNLVVADNVIRDTALQGMKVQLGVSNVADATQIAISGNVLTNTGSHGILLTNAMATSIRVRRVTVTGNTVSSTGSASGGDGIQCAYVIGATLIGNSLFNMRKGINIGSSSSQIIVALNRIENCSDQGILFDSSSDLQFYQNRIINPATANGGSTEYGIQGTGGTTTNVVIDGNIVSDSGGNMRYGLFLSGTDQANIVIRGNDFSGATDYGVRVDSTVGIKEWNNNVTIGGIGAVTGFPSSLVVKGRPREFVANAMPSSGTYVLGDIAWNSAPSTSTFGWVCTTAGTPGTWSVIGSSTSTPTNVQFFSASGTWTKPSGAKTVTVTLISGGGGGGSGRKGAAGSVRCGGGGGGGGGITVNTIDASLLGSTVAVTVGTGGGGGGAVTTTDTNGNAGSGGAGSLFGGIRSFQGAAGAGGTNSTGTAGAGGAGTSTGGTGGAASATGGVGVNSAGASAATGGGGGGGITSGDVANIGGSGATSWGAAASTVGVVDGTLPSNGTSVTAGLAQPGSGGAGGSASITTDAQNGGAGGSYGAGGAGGGAALNTAGNSGAGGAGAPGCVLVITYF